MAKRTPSKLTPPISAPAMIERMKSSGMMKVGDMMMRPSAAITPRMPKPTGAKRPARSGGALPRSDPKEPDMPKRIGRRTIEHWRDGECIARIEVTEKMIQRNEDGTARVVFPPGNIVTGDGRRVALRRGRTGRVLEGSQVMTEDETATQPLPLAEGRATRGGRDVLRARPPTCWRHGSPSHYRGRLGPAQA